MKIFPKSLYRFANIAIKVTLILFSILGVLSFKLVVDSPDDYLQGVFAKIMYIHVPSAWFAMLYYTILTVFSALFLASKNPIFDILAKAIAPVGAICTAVTLFTGSLWGKPTWGTWWVWDARLTSMLVLFFIYLAYLSIRNLQLEQYKVAKFAAVFAIIGFVNIPVIKFSVELWNTLHQGASVFRFSGSSIHSSMLIPLSVSALALLFLTLNIAFMRIVIILRPLTRNSRK